ncbi:MAG: HEAT repeat domain-containing protein [Verrucomicrobia bacterium]|nr:HEAT repeat domain-containing protein [Verrucomicrobiota bacterium]
MELALKDIEHARAEDFSNRIVQIIADGPEPVAKEAIKTQIIGWLIAKLSDGKEKVRYNAVAALGVIGSTKAVEPLIAQLADEDVRSCVASALGKIGDTRAVSPLIALLSDKDKITKFWLEDALIAIGKPSVEPMIAKLSDKDSDIRESAARVLGRISDPRAVAPLIAELGDRNNHVRYYVIEALGKIGDIRAVEPLIPRINDRDSTVCYHAIEVLGNMKDVRAAGALVTLLHNEKFRRVAADALAKIGPPSLNALHAAYPKEKTHPYWADLVLANCGDNDALTGVVTKLAEDTYPTDEKKTLFSYYLSPALLLQIEGSAKDAGLRIAAQATRGGKQEWNQILNAAADNLELLEPTLSAIAYTETEFGRTSHADDLIELCIQHGNDRYIPKLVGLLDRYGDYRLASIFLHCGQNDLANAARAWAKRNHETLSRDPVFASERWGDIKRKQPDL